MACAHCERIRKLAHQAKEKAMAHARRLAGLRAGVKDVEAEGVAEQDAATTTQDAKPSARAKPASKANLAHGKRSVAKAPRGGAAS